MSPFINISSQRCFLIWVALLLINYSVHGAPPRFTPKDMEQLVLKAGLDFDYYACISVIEGDILKLEGLGLVRLLGVDSSERMNHLLPLQFLSREAATFTRELCLGRNIRLEFDTQDTDFRGDDGLLQAYAFIEGGGFVQEKLLRRGFAVIDRSLELDDGYLEKFRLWRDQALENGLGLWRDNGLAEVQWIEERAAEQAIEIARAKDGNSWSIRVDSLQKSELGSGTIDAEVEKLITWIHAYSSQDLQRIALKNGYKPVEMSFSDVIWGNSIHLRPMTFKRWSISFGDLVFPWVIYGEVEICIDWMDEKINNTSAEQLSWTLLHNGFIKKEVASL